MVDAQMLHLIFNFLSFSPGPFWLILALAPKNKKAMLAFDIYLILLSATFAYLTLPHVPSLIPTIASPTFEAIQKFISSDLGTLGSWNHMILGDLWIGRWVIHDAIKNGVHAVIRIPLLMIILFFGPLGLFFYLLYRIVILRRLILCDVSETGR